LLRCAQEALTNARKHAEARVVEIGLDKERLVVRDDGHGMGGAEPGFGLQSMRARCKALGCELAIASSPHGTQVAIRWTGEGAS
jgi:signal transduction histidine kinase